MTHTVTVQLPEHIYSRFAQSASVTRTSVEELIIQSVKAGMPPSVDDLPREYQAEFLAMERLTDRQLWQIARSMMSAGRQRRYTALLRKNQAGTLTERDRAQLARLGHEARYLTLRKAHAFALLKWRGHRIPALMELK